MWSAIRKVTGGDIKEVGERGYCNRNENFQNFGHESASLMPPPWETLDMNVINQGKHFCHTDKYLLLIFQTSLIA